MVLQISWQLTSEEEAEVQHTNSSVKSTKDNNKEAEVEVEEEAEVQHTNSSVISTKDDFAR